MGGRSLSLVSVGIGGRWDCDGRADVDAAAAGPDVLSIKGVQMRVLIKKSGNGASVRIPVAVTEVVGLSRGQAKEGSRVAIERVPGPVFSLPELLSEVTNENIHDEVDFGRPVGKERL